MARYTLANPLNDGHSFTKEGTPTGKATAAGQPITLTPEQARDLAVAGYLNVDAVGKPVEASASS